MQKLTAKEKGELIKHVTDMINGKDFYAIMFSIEQEDESYTVGGSIQGLPPSGVLNMCMQMLKNGLGLSNEALSDIVDIVAEDVEK